MPRPRLPRHIRFIPGVYYFKPQGIPMYQLEEEVLFADELEALKLYDVDLLDQTKASRKMGVSQPTFARILKSAREKLSRSVIEGKAIRIEKF